MGDGNRPAGIAESGTGWKPVPPCGDIPVAFVQTMAVTGLVGFVGCGATNMSRLRRWIASVGRPAASLGLSTGRLPGQTGPKQKNTVKHDKTPENIRPSSPRLPRRL